MKTMITVLLVESGKARVRRGTWDDDGGFRCKEFLTPTGEWDVVDSRCEYPESSLLDCEDRRPPDTGDMKQWVKNHIDGSKLKFDALWAEYHDIANRVARLEKPEKAEPIQLTSPWALCSDGSVRATGKIGRDITVGAVWIDGVRFVREVRT